MTVRRHKHKSLPKVVKLGDIHKDRIWVMHPTKGLRSKKVFVLDTKPTGIALVDIFKYIYKKVLV